MFGVTSLSLLIIMLILMVSKVKMSGIKQRPQSQVYLLMDMDCTI